MYSFYIVHLCAIDIRLINAIFLLACWGCFEFVVVPLLQLASPLNELGMF